MSIWTWTVVCSDAAAVMPDWSIIGTKASLNTNCRTYYPILLHTRRRTRGSTVRPHATSVTPCQRSRTPFTMNDHDRYCCSVVPGPAQIVMNKIGQVPSTIWKTLVISIQFNLMQFIMPSPVPEMYSANVRCCNPSVRLDVSRRCRSVGVPL